MGYVTAFDTCYSCSTLFSFNPNLVPSIRVNASGAPDSNGVRRPVCRSCMERANTIRVKAGLEPHSIHPEAYEAADEHAINWDG